MRLVKTYRTLLLLALSAVLATSILAQDAPNIRPNSVRDQLMQADPGGSNSQSAPPAPAKAPAKAPVENPAKPAGETRIMEKTSFAKRDPFSDLIAKGREGNVVPANLPPGKAGLLVGMLRVQGVVSSPNAVIAIVSNPQERVYFLREGDKLYDGMVGKITLEAISFQEFGKDAFGRTVERVVTKRIYPSPGEQQ